jgi:hypothetical protein
VPTGFHTKNDCICGWPCKRTPTSHKGPTVPARIRGTHVVTPRQSEFPGLLPTNALNKVGSQPIGHRSLAGWPRTPCKPPPSRSSFICPTRNLTRLSGPLAGHLFELYSCFVQSSNAFQHFVRVDSKFVRRDIGPFDSAHGGGFP